MNDQPIRQTAPYEIKAIAYYKRIIGILSLLLLSLSLLIFLLINHNMNTNREFLKRLKTRDIVVLEGRDIKIAKVGYRGHKIVRKFVLDSVQDMLTYSVETYCYFGRYHRNQERKSLRSYMEASGSEK